MGYYEERLPANIAAPLDGLKRISGYYGNLHVVYQDVGYGMVVSELSIAELPARRRSRKHAAREVIISSKPRPEDEDAPAKIDFETIRFYIKGQFTEEDKIEMEEWITYFLDMAWRHSKRWKQ